MLCAKHGLALIGLLTWAGGVSIGSAQAPLQRLLLPEPKSPSGTTNSTAKATGETIEERLAKARAELAGVKASGDTTVVNRLGVAVPDPVLRRSLLERLVRLYEQQVSYAAELAMLKQSRGEVTREANGWKGFSEPRPYSVLLVDSLREAIAAERLEIANGESALSRLAKLTEDHRGMLNHAEENIRRLNEQLESAANRDDGIRQREVERLRSQTEAATLAVLDFERQIREERLGISRIRMDLLKRQIVFANAGATFSNEDMQRVLARLDAADGQAEKELAEANTKRQAALKALEAANEEFRRAETNAAVIAQARELVDLRRAQLETADTAVAVLRFILQAATIERSMWQARFASYDSRNAASIRGAERQLEQFRSRLELWRGLYRNQLEGASSQVALQQERLADMDATSPLVSLVHERLATLRERDQSLLRVVRLLERGDRLLARLGEGLREASDNLPVTARLRNAVADTGSWLGRLWRFEVFVAEDTIVVDGQKITGKRGVTLGKIITAVLILVIGYWLTGLISRVTEPIVIKRFKIDANQANLIRRWVRVALVFALALFSMVSVKIPLTVFAFAGGALVIGLGFGMQTIIKNFVSGIIILFERPFRVGDVLDVAGQRGMVVGIGIRSSVIQQGDGTETLIPNSTLLENTVTNWTYSSRKVRFTVKVGVAYGSDTRRVVALLNEVTERHGLVEKNPAPQILFVDFAASALVFELQFWVDVIKVNAGQVASDLRQMIAGTFAENKIVMAFPQHDVHVDTTGPLRVQILPFADARDSAADGNGSGKDATVRASTDSPEKVPSESETKPKPQLP